MNETFEQEITFLSKQFNPETNNWENKNITKKVKFKELNQSDRNQHKLHFMIISLFESTGENDKAEISTDKLYDITVKFIKNMVVINEDFVETDKEEFLNDSAALLSFAFWLLNNKITPFFSIFSMK